MSEIKINEYNRDLLVDIRNTIKSLVDGSISIETASLQFKRLNQRYENLLEKKPERPSNILNLLCAAHTGENFSKYSGIWEINESDIRPLYESGISKIRDVSLNFLKNAEEFDIALNHSELTMHGTENEYRLILDKIKTDSPDLFAVCVTSSPYFSLNRFTIFGTICCQLVSSTELNEIEDSCDYLDSVCKSIDQYLKNNIKSGSATLIKLYRFEDLTSAFSHLGTREMLGIMERILFYLRNNYGYTSLIQSVSPELYIVVVPEENNIPAKNQPFSIKGISVPYVVKETAVYNFIPSKLLLNHIISD